MHGELIETANAIALRYDAGICRHKYEHPGVVEIYKMVDKINVIGEMDNSDGTLESANRVYGDNGIAPTVPTCSGGGIQPKVLECKIVAMRSRDKDDPTGYRGKSNGNMEQHLEPNSEGICNTITSVQKDNLVLIKQATKDGYVPCEVGGVCDLNYPTSKTRRGRVQGNGQICPALTTENIPSVLEPWIWEVDGVKYLIRIRKLTPKECWRLMGFTDEDFDKAQTVNSNTQLYKQAGNSIVTDVLENLFSKLIE